jgi:hypothetical protein
MNESSSPSTKLFFGLAIWIVAWRLMPAGDAHPTIKLFNAVLAFAGALFVIGAIKEGRKAGPWWQGFGGRLIAVLSLWAAIFAAARVSGTPHLLYEYPPRQPDGQCLYFGWNGWVVASARGDGVSRGCRTVEWL